MNHSDARAQANTLPTAVRLGTHWTQADLDKLRALLGEGKVDREVAVSLQRSLYAVRAAKRILTERREHAPKTPTASRAVLPYDLGFTSLEAMGF